MGVGVPSGVWGLDPLERVAPASPSLAASLAATWSNCVATFLSNVMSSPMLAAHIELAGDQVHRRGPPAGRRHCS